MPEAGCVVATAKKLRAQRYLVEADCTEGSEPFQHHFILDIISNTSIRMDGMPLVSCTVPPGGSKISKETEEKIIAALPLRNVPLAGAIARSKPAKRAEPKASSPSKLILQWHEANENCRGGFGDDPATYKACDKRHGIGQKLASLKWCYGKDGQSLNEYEWHRCTKRSNHEAGD